MKSDQEEPDLAQRPEAKPGGRMPLASLGSSSWSEISVLYGREMRSALREKSIVINSLLLPVLLYPFILWIAFTAILFLQGQSDRMAHRIAVTAWPEGHPGLKRLFELKGRVRLVDHDGSISQLQQLVREGRLDLAMDLQGSEQAPGITNFTALLICNESREASLKSRELAQRLINDYRQSWLKREAMRRGVSAGQWEHFSITSQNVASAKEVGRFILGLMLPILFVVMVAMGCFFPAVDATAGERERGTWETLMGTSANRMSIITAKYLYVATLGGIAGILNLAAMLITVKPLFAPLLAKAGESIVFSLPLPALPLLLLGAILMAGFVSAGMMIFAAFAKTFKEGQAMITPFYLVVLLPLMFLQVPGLKFTLPLAFIPIVNVAMMVRSAISGEFPLGPIAVTLVISGLAIFLALRLGMYIIQFEEVLLGGRSGGLARFLKRRLSPQRASPANPRT